MCSAQEKSGTAPTFWFTISSAPMDCSTQLTRHTALHMSQPRSLTMASSMGYNTLNTLLFSPSYNHSLCAITNYVRHASKKINTKIQ
jgi:hypothetical protein